MSNYTKYKKYNDKINKNLYGGSHNIFSFVSHGCIYPDIPNTIDIKPNSYFVRFSNDGGYMYEYQILLIKNALSFDNIKKIFMNYILLKITDEKENHEMIVLLFSYGMYKLLSELFITYGHDAKHIAKHYYMQINKEEDEIYKSFPEEVKLNPIYGDTEIENLKLFTILMNPLIFEFIYKFNLCDNFNFDYFKTVILKDVDVFLKFVNGIINDHIDAIPKDMKLNIKIYDHTTKLPYMQYNLDGLNDFKFFEIKLRHLYKYSSNFLYGMKSGLQEIRNILTIDNFILERGDFCIKDTLGKLKLLELIDESSREELYVKTMLDFNKQALYKLLNDTLYPPKEKMIEIIEYIYRFNNYFYGNDMNLDYTVADKDLLNSNELIKWTNDNLSNSIFLMFTCSPIGC